MMDILNPAPRRPSEWRPYIALATAVVLDTLEALKKIRDAEMREEMMGFLDGPLVRAWCDVTGRDHRGFLDRAMKGDYYARHSIPKAGRAQRPARRGRPGVASREFLEARR